MHTQQSTNQHSQRPQPQQTQRNVLRPPLILLRTASPNIIFQQLKGSPQCPSYLKAGLAVEPGWHSNIRACYYVMLHVLLEAEQTYQTMEFQNNFERLLRSDQIKLDTYRIEQIDPAYRSLYSHDTLIALIQDFMRMAATGQNLLQ